MHDALSSTIGTAWRARRAAALAVSLAATAACVPARHSDTNASPAVRDTPAPAREAPAGGATASAFVAAHNDWRREAGVPALTWSEALAGHARQHAARLEAAGCPLEHDTDDFGENLYAAQARPGPPDGAPGNAVAAWASEREDYSYERNDCRPGAQCGHYTQLVWSDTRFVGCGSALCDSADGWETLVWVCKYDPPGNYVGERPY